MCALYRVWWVGDRPWVCPTAPGSPALSLCPIPVPTLLRGQQESSRASIHHPWPCHPRPGLCLSPGAFGMGMLWAPTALPWWPWLLSDLCPGMRFWSSFYPLGNASSAALAVIWLQFGPGDLGQVTDKGPASPLATGAGPAVGVSWCGAGMLLGTPGMQEESAGFGGFRGKEEVFWMNTGVMPTCFWALSVAEPRGGSGLKENLCQGSSAASPGSGRGWVGRWRSGHPAPHTPRFGGG